MALPILPNTDNFLGVALVINRSRDGPRFVFHYPQSLQPSSGANTNTHGPSSGSGLNPGDLDDDDSVLPSRPSRDVRIETGTASAVLAAELAQWNHDDHLVTESGTQIVPWEHVAGFPTKDLENILTPARAYHKRLFQVSLDPIYCVSYPIQVPENGVWRKKKKKKPGDEKRGERQRLSQTLSQKDSAGGGSGGLRKEEDDSRSGGEKGPSDEGERVDVRDMANPTTTQGRTADEAEDKKSSMTMFNLVFFLNPKKHEVKPLVDIMFTHIIKKINKAYKYCQQRSDFVWKESKRILALKDKGREDKRKMSSLWEEILSTSSLAASMQDIYEAVSQNRIAALQLDTPEGTVTHSVQIPVPFHVSDLPDQGEKGRDGLWLTTANSLMAEEAVETPGFLDRNFALLLMMDEKRVVAELQNDPDETTLAMIEFVRHCKPSLSFHQVCQLSSNILTPAQVRKYAQHFIFWRRAIAIPPLHARDMYIVSPNCDMCRLPQAAMQWARQFPLSPSLPNFLAELSVAPRPYKLHCPSKAHRPVYMAMLAWLMRGGWVTQLCTFAYVVVWPEIIYEVEHALEAEDIARAYSLPDKGRESGNTEEEERRQEENGGGGADLGTDAEGGPGTSTAATTPGAFPSTASPGLGDSAVSAFHSGFLPLLAEPHDQTSPSTPGLRNLSLSHSHSPIYPTTTTTSTPNSPFSTRIASPMQLPTFHSTSTGPDDDYNDDNNNTHPSHHNHNHSNGSSPPSEPTPVEKAAEKARLARLADRAARALAERATAHARKAAPQQTAHPSVNRAPHLDGITPHVILDAKKATGRESLYLSAIEKRLRERRSGGGGRIGERERERDRVRGFAGSSTKHSHRHGQHSSNINRRNPTTNRLNTVSTSTINTTTTTTTTTTGTSTNDTTTTAKPTTDPNSNPTANNHNNNNSNNPTNNNNNNNNPNPTTLDWDERVANAWPVLCKYFNGRSALERIALQEDMKRKDVWNLLTGMSEYLLSVRHW